MEVWDWEPKALRRRIFALVILMASTACARVAEAPSEPLRRGDYAGSGIPTRAPSLFAPGFLTFGTDERDTALSPSGDEIFFTVWSGAFGVILVTTRDPEGGWSVPRTASFSGEHSDLEPFLSGDGRRLYFASNRPLESSGEAKDYDLWLVERTEGGEWGAARNLGAPVNSERNEFYPSLSLSGTFYYTARFDGGRGGEDLYASEPAGDGFGPPRNLGEGVNTEKDEFNSLIAPDESYILFSSFGRDDGNGGGDLYVSYSDGQGGWHAARNLTELNSPALDYCPALSPDGRILFFTSRRSSLKPVASRWGYADLMDQLQSPGNGRGDLYWVTSDVLDDYRP